MHPAHVVLCALDFKLASLGLTKRQCNGTSFALFALWYSLWRRNQFDRLAFAVHAYMLADEYKLVAVAADAEDSKGMPAETRGRLFLGLGNVICAGLVVALPISAWLQTQEANLRKSVWRAGQA